MNCEQARLLLAFARPHASELDVAEQQLLEQHLKSCPTCAAAVEQERQLDERLGQAMRNVAIPDGLKERLLVRMANERSAVHRHRFLVWGLPAAAAIMVSVCGAWWWTARHPLSVDAGSFVAHSTMPPPKTFEEAEERIRHDPRFAALRLPKELTTRWDPKLIVEQRVLDYDGQPAPTLIFRKGDSVAEVSFFPASKISADTLTARYPDQVRLIGNKDGNYVALVVIKHGNFHDFVKSATPTT